MLTHFRLSALLHALLLLVALTLPMGGSGDGTSDKGEAKDGRGSKDEPLDVTIVSPPKEKDVVVEESAELQALKRIAPHAGDTCANFYGGIGIMDGMSGVVEVYPGYPAHRAGILVGDTIISGDPIRGDVGTEISVTVLRGMRRMSFTLVRDKICVA